MNHLKKWHHSRVSDPFRGASSTVLHGQYQLSDINTGPQCSGPYGDAGSGLGAPPSETHVDR